MSRPTHPPPLDVPLLTESRCPGVPVAIAMCGLGQVVSILNAFRCALTTADRMEYWVGCGSPRGENALLCPGECPASAKCPGGGHNSDLPSTFSPNKPPTRTMPEINLGFAQNLLPSSAVPPELTPFISQEQWEEIVNLLLSAANINVARNCSCLPFFSSANDHQLPPELDR
jgi:hypothetical protein